MAEKRVAVRLAAVGGQQVRAELEGVGEAGKRGFGRLSQEMEAANARLAAFSRRVKIAAAAAVAAAAAAGVAMIRSGLQVVDAQTKLAASLGTTTESVQVLARAGDLAGVSMGEIEQATLQLTRRLAQAAQGAGPAVKALERLRLTAEELRRLPLDQRIAAIQEALATYVPEAERAAVASQLFGDRAGLVFSRIDTATLRQAAADVRDFGVAVSDQDARQIERTNDALSRLGLIWRGLSNQLAVAAAPALEAVANAMAALARTTGPLGLAIKGLFDNIGRLATYAATFAAFMAGRWVAGMVAAAVSVRGLATALVLLRGALIRTGIGALIVAAGELIYQFGRLVRGAGGFGEAMRLMGDVAREVWERIGMGGETLGLVLRSVFARIEALWLTVLSTLQKGWADFLHRVAAAARNIPGLDETALALGNSAIRAGSAYYEFAAAADAARTKADDLAQSARDTAAAMTAPLSSIAARRAAMRDASDDSAAGMQRATDAAARFNETIESTGRSATAAKPKVKETPEAAKTGWQAALAALQEYADKAKEVGKEVGDALVRAFKGMEDAIVKFVTTGKLEFRTLVDSIVADLIRIQLRKNLLGPLANWLGGLFGGSGGGLFAGLFHEGGLVTAAGGMTRRPMPALAFAHAPRMHRGGMMLRPDEVPAILQIGERVLSRREVAALRRDREGPREPPMILNFNITTPDAGSFRRSQSQLVAEMASAMERARRNL